MDPVQSMEALSKLKPKNSFKPLFKSLSGVHDLDDARRRRLQTLLGLFLRLQAGSKTLNP